jgi:ketosteroid isomerase-like protein
MKLLIFSAIFLGVCSISYAQPTPSPTPEQRSPEQEAVHKAVEEMVAALGRNDVPALERLTTPDYMFVNPAGKVWNRAQYFELIRSGTLKVESYTQDEEIIRLYGNTAVVIYRSAPKGTFKGQELTSQRRVTTVFIKQGDRWLATGRQSTPIVEMPK